MFFRVYSNLKIGDSLYVKDVYLEPKCFIWNKYNNNRTNTKIIVIGRNFIRSIFDTRYLSARIKHSQALVNSLEKSDSVSMHTRP